AKIKIGDTSEITLDAYGPDTLFKAKVVQVDLQATVVEGVATYKTTIQFLNEDKRILAGLTANVNILSDKKKNVLYALTRSIISDDGKKFVEISKDKKKNIKEKIEIKIGLKGSDGRTEIISGLKEGDVVISK
ncbi:efflux RND transporter periplasmic adaptor subunit, partial [Candidatus Wolfebacteria bacterium]|nr:efflux RND transporter periplasmic adaptor subunit [Candidatus Wolfebacteria bacterium]